MARIISLDPPLPDNLKFQEIVWMLIGVQYHKEKGYGSSWKKNGEYRSIVPNVDRKYDRISNIINGEMGGNLPKLPLKKPSDMTLDEWDALIGESKIDSIADLANYCILYLTWLRENYPDAFDTWVRKNVPPYAIPTVQK